MGLVRVKQSENEKLYEEGGGGWVQQGQGAGRDASSTGQQLPTGSWLSFSRVELRHRQRAGDDEYVRLIIVLPVTKGHRCWFIRGPFKAFSIILDASKH